LARSKKFGTFGGVFTPSVLTILGVIMYLRLPWIVGQGGLIATLAIILVAHIVSITTGLSVASIATDKKVQAGGNYYIISRSMGLSVGGTLGLALFVGLSFSISLYIIGFCESLLGVLGLPLEINTIRFYGTITLVVITIIIFISTSLAIKAQYFILAAVGLSILAIFFGGNPTTGGTYSLMPAENSVDIFVLFGVFFPAVTGFTAGVQMSGDLKDPKTALPLGTIAAISVGFIVYVGLAIYTAFYIDRNTLTSPNIFVEIAMVPQLVIAGIWGATISSAMGSILGAPRILQATSKDGVTPRFFAKGYGPSNEPRNALLLTFIIAEAGILIGDLNVIARVVSMFFISTYGLINISYVLESWASTDFRPSFRVPLWVGLVGAIVCGIVMFQLDIVAFFGAIIVLALVYLIIKRKELTLETGDTWGSFWASVVRSGLHKLNEEVIHKRNWRPNILLFGGMQNVRPYLLQFGKWLTGRSGIISNFELIESPDGQVRFPKAAQLMRDPGEARQGVFYRRLESRDVYSGIESVARFYGFAGVEPNTVLMGWPKKSDRAEPFAEMLKTLQDLDYNILLLNYDPERQFGEYKTIDLWWRGGSNNASLAMYLLRFLHGSAAWQRARLRILIIVDDGSLINKVHRNMKHLLQDLRQDADIKVINNAIEQRPFSDILQLESAGSDLTILGMPQLTPAAQKNFLGSMHQLLEPLKSVLLISASSYFDPIFIGIESSPRRRLPDAGATPETAGTELRYPANDALSARLRTVNEDLEKAINEFYAGYISEVVHEFERLGDQLNRICDGFLGALSRRVSGNAKNGDSAPLIERFQNDLLYNNLRLINDFKENSLNILERNVEQGCDVFLGQLRKVFQDSPIHLRVNYPRHDLAMQDSDNLRLRFLKLRKKAGLFLSKREEAIFDVPFTELMREHINGVLRGHFYAQIEQLAVIGYQHISDLQKFFSRLQALLQGMMTRADQGQLNEKFVQETKQKLLEDLRQFRDKNKKAFKENSLALLETHRRAYQEKLDALSTLSGAAGARKRFQLRGSDISDETFMDAAGSWTRNLGLILDFARMELTLHLFQNRLGNLLHGWQKRNESSLNGPLREHIDKINAVLQKAAGESQNPPADIFEKELEITLPGDVSELESEVQKHITELPEIIQVMSEQSFQELEDQPFHQAEVVSVYLRRLIGYLAETEFMPDLQTYGKELQTRVSDTVTALNGISQLMLVSGSERAADEYDFSNEQKTISEVATDGLQRLEDERENVKAALSQTRRIIQERLSHFFDKMNPYLLTNATSNLRQYIFSHEQRKVLSGVEAFRDRFQRRLRDMVVNLQYSRSIGVLIARRLSRAGEKQKGNIDALISLTQSISPHSPVTQGLPRYYRQLFLGEHSISRQFLVAQNEAFRYAERVLIRYRNGFRGALLVLGDPRSGKTALCRMIASRTFERSHIFRFNPPPGGSIDTEVFARKVIDLAGGGQTIDQAMEALPDNSVMIINDLEMWWERHENGYKVIDMVRGLVDRYGHKCFFLINCNSYAFQLLNEVLSLEDTFLGIIRCEPFNAREIETAVMQRHRSTGLRFEVNRENEEDISELKLARLFNRIFSYTSGNIGVALQTWLVMIDHFSAERIRLRPLTKPDMSVIQSLDTQWYVWLIQFILHRQLTRERLARLFGIEREEVNRQVEVMMRSGFVIKNEAGALQINPYLEHLFIEEFREMGLLWNNS